MSQKMPAGQANKLLARILSLSYEDIKKLNYSNTLVTDIRKLCQQTLSSSPCLWQIRAAFAILKGQKDVICVARTGAGKSLTFYLPLIVRTEGVMIIVIPLNALATDMAARLSDKGLSAIAVTAANATAKNFSVRHLSLKRNPILTSYQDIFKRKYRVVITNPETLLGKNGQFLTLLKNRKFTKHIISIVIDCQAEPEGGSRGLIYIEVGTEIIEGLRG